MTIPKTTDSAETTDALLTETANAVGKVIGQLKLEHPTSLEMFDVRDLTPEQFQELKSACANHLSPMIAAQEHCRQIKKRYEETKGSMSTKREQHTYIPMSFWKILEKMLTDTRIKDTK